MDCIQMKIIIEKKKKTSRTFTQQQQRYGHKNKAKAYFKSRNFHKKKFIVILQFLENVLLLPKKKKMPKIGKIREKIS